MIGQTDRGTHVPATVPLQVNDKVFHSLGFQLLHRLLELLHRRGGKAGNLDITDILVDHVRSVNTINRNHITYDIKINDLVPSLHFHLHDRAFFPFQAFSHVRVADTDPGNILPVNGDNPVSRQQADLLGRPPGNDIHHY